jgi:hypothetical protein
MTHRLHSSRSAPTVLAWKKHMADTISQNFHYPHPRFPPNYSPIPSVFPSLEYSRIMPCIPYQIPETSRPSHISHHLTITFAITRPARTTPRVTEFEIASGSKRSAHKSDRMVALRVPYIQLGHYDGSRELIGRVWRKLAE